MADLSLDDLKRQMPRPDKLGVPIHGGESGATFRH
jgi:hypothetical protein